MNRLALGLLVTVTATGCSYYETKQKEDTTPVAAIDPATLSYEKLTADVFSPKCFSCHTTATGNSGGVNLETYASVKGQAAKIKSQVTLKAMPLGGALTASQIAEVSAWVDAGTPEQATK